MTDIACWKCGERSSIDHRPPYKCSFCKARLRRAEGSWKHTLRMEIESREREGIASLGSADIPALGRFLTVTKKDLAEYIGIALQEPASTETTTTPIEAASTTIAISGRPLAEDDGDRPYVAIPINLTPSSEWIGRFRSSLSLPLEWSLDFDDQEMILDGPMTDIESVLTLISDAIDFANNSATTAQTELDHWWDRRRATPEADDPTPPEPNTVQASPTTLSVEEGNNGGGAILGWSLSLGIASIFLGGLFGIVPIITVVVSLIAVGTKTGRGIWMGWIGLMLGIVFTLVYLNNYGYLGDLSAWSLD